MRATGGAGEVLPRGGITRSCLLKLRARRPLKPGEGGYTAVARAEARMPVCAGEAPDLMTQREVLQGELAPRLE